MKVTVTSTNGLVRDETELTTDDIDRITWIVNNYNRRGIQPYAGLISRIMKRKGFWSQDYSYWTRKWKGWIFSKIDVTIDQEETRATIRMKRKGVSR